MPAYNLAATHSISRDRARETRNSKASVKIRCTLEVHNLMLQTAVQTLLDDPPSSRYLGPVSISDVSCHAGVFGAKVWMFTVRLYACDKKVKLRHWGRRRSQAEIAALPAALLKRIEQSVNDVLLEVVRDRTGLAMPSATLRILP